MQVWLNLDTGEFSNSWPDKGEQHTSDLIAQAQSPEVKGNWKLITYQCENDPDFEFCAPMRLP